MHNISTDWRKFGVNDSCFLSTTFGKLRPHQWIPLSAFQSLKPFFDETTPPPHLYRCKSEGRPYDIHHDFL